MLVETALTFARRWLLTLLVLLLSGGAAVGTYLAVPATLRSTAQVLFLPPVTQAGVVGQVNPFLSLGGSMGTTASVVQVRVSDDATAERLAKAGATAKYTVAPNLGENAGPILIVTADARDPAVAQSTASAVVDEIRVQIQALQTEAQAPSGSLITTTVLTASPEPVAVHTTSLRVAGVTGVALLAVLAIGLLLLDRRQMGGREPGAREGGRRSPRGAAAAVPAHPAPCEPPAVEPLAARTRTAQTSTAGPATGSDTDPVAVDPAPAPVGRDQRARRREPAARRP